jgi:hypothetical protein
VSYCSGDVFGGNVVRDYTDSKGQPVTQKGLVNAQSALDWVKTQVKTGALASTFDELVVMGCSAGSIGAQLWADQVTSQLKWKKAAVVPDSYAGDFPDGTMGPLVYGYGFCTSGFLSSDLQTKCDKQQLTLQDIANEYMVKNTKIPFAYLQSKTDSVQKAFYESVAVSMNASSKTITPAQFYMDVNTIFGGYNQLPNFVTYLVDGDHHCFTNQDLYYQATTLGPNGIAQEPMMKFTSTQKMHEWTSLWPLDEAGISDTQCSGNQGSSSANDLTYCDTTVVPKHYEQHY